MNRSYRIIPCYTGDVSGAASALYELGGMVVIHDPSGCNSTYNTHDETRWYDHDSLIFISGLTQTDAILGNDEKFIEDIEEAARELHPKFIALASSPIPYMNGTDFEAIARILEEDLGIPAFFVPTNGMHDYVYGAGNALVKVAERLLDLPCDADSKVCEKPEGHGSFDETSEQMENMPGKNVELCDKTGGIPEGEDKKIRVNILGMTPLDYAAKGSLLSLKMALQIAGFLPNVCWAMGSKLEELQEKTKLADVNLVVSSLGLPVAKKLQAMYNTPYVIGVPIGRFASVIWRELREDCGSGDKEPVSKVVYKECTMAAGRLNSIQSHAAPWDSGAPDLKKVLLIGDPVIMNSLGLAYSMKHPEMVCHVACPLEVEEEVLNIGDYRSYGEEDLENYMQELHRNGNLDLVVADPLYRSICPAGVEFHELPHEAFSGRCFAHGMQNLIELRP